MKRESMPLVFKFKPCEGDPGHFDVFVEGVEIGCVYYDEEAWSEGRWFILGDRVETKRGGVWGATTKPIGFRNRTLAARELARMQSSLIISAICKEAAV